MKVWNRNLGNKRDQLPAQRVTFHDATFAYILVSLPSASVRFKASIAHKFNASGSDAKNALIHLLKAKISFNNVEDE